MTLDLSDTELDYTYRLLLTRPMGEVEAIVLKVRQQVNVQQQQRLQLVKPPTDEPLEALP